MDNILLSTVQTPHFITIFSLLLYAIIDSVRDEIKERQKDKPQKEEPEFSYFELGAINQR